MFIVTTEYNAIRTFWTGRGLSVVRSDAQRYSTISGATNAFIEMFYAGVLVVGRALMIEEA